MSPEQIEQFAATVWQARSDRQTLDASTIESRCGGPTTMDDAYRIGGAVLRRRIERGERPVGWKLGYTSLAMRQQMGVDQPNHGRLTDHMLIPNGGSIPESVLQPRVEPEIAVTIARDMTSVPTTVSQVLDSIDVACACLEVVDSVWTDYRFRIEHNTADGSSAAFVVLGEPLALDDLASIPVALFSNEQQITTATGAAASGHPLAGVAWLAGVLAREDRYLRAGDVIITACRAGKFQPLRVKHRFVGGHAVVLGERDEPKTRVT